MLQSVAKEVRNDELIYFQIGDRIRKYRNEKGLKLLALAAASNVSAAMLSKIENGRIIPTIPTLFSIINTLGISPDVFFSDLNKANKFPGYFFIPQSDYTSYIKEENAKGFSYSSILEHSVNSQSFQMSLLKLSPDAKRPPVTTSGFEFIYLIEGSIKYYLDKKCFILEAGDSLYFDGNIPHVPENNSRKTALLLVLYFFSDSH